MTEAEYWQQRADRESHLAQIEHSERLAVLEEIKQSILGAVWQYEEHGRTLRATT